MSESSTLPFSAPRSGIGNDEQREQQERHEKDDSSSNAVFVSKLQANDVLMGRGARITTNQGNVRFIEIIRGRCPEYQATSSRKQKHIIAQQIASNVRCRNGRFLREIATPTERKKLGVPDDSTDTAWASVDESTVLLKIKQALRDQGLRMSSTDKRHDDKGGIRSKPPKKRHKRATRVVAQLVGDTSRRLSPQVRKTRLSR